MRPGVSGSAIGGPVILVNAQAEEEEREVHECMAPQWQEFMTRVQQTAAEIKASRRTAGFMRELMASQEHEVHQFKAKQEQEEQESQAKEDKATSTKGLATVLG